MKVLIIDDDESLRQEITDWLTFEGYETVSASNGMDGVKLARQQPPDLILCDISMPGLDGYGVLLEVNATPALQSTPFIFMSAKSERHEIRKGMQMGADDYLTKPFTQPELLGAIQSRLEKKSLQMVEFQQQVDSFKQALEIDHQDHLLQARLVAMFSHEFRNQLAIIKSYASLARDYAHKTTEEARRKWLDSILAADTLLEAILDDLLTLAQMQTSNFVVRQEKVNITEFIQRIVEEYQNGLGRDHCLRMTSSLSDIINTDERLLRQVVTNLISNAIKYSASGSDIDISLESLGNQYSFIIRDYGIGIPETDMNRLFEMFQRGSNVGRVNGTGLGLVVLKNAVVLLGGTVELDSQEGVGTTFRVTFSKQFETA